MARILVVEDEDDLREIILEELNEGGHNTVEASDGQKGLDRLAKEPVDLIISDITMPNMNGYQFFRSVKEQFPEHAQTPFIFLTALSDRDSEFKGLRLGVDDYLTKPIDFELMLLRIEVHLRKRTPPAATSPQPARPNDAIASVPVPAPHDHQAAAQLKSTLQVSSEILASRFVTISLEAIRAHVGSRWESVSQQIIHHAEQVIRAQLSPTDFFSVTPSHDFIVCFAQIDDDQFNAKTSLMRDEIWERLFAVTHDEQLSQVDAQSHRLVLDLDDIEDDVVFVEIDKAIDQKNSKDAESKKKQLDQIYSFEEFYAYPLLGATGGPSKIKALSFNRKITERVRELSRIGQNEWQFMLELQRKIFARLQEKDNIKKAFTQHAMLLPIDFTLLVAPEARDELMSLCQHFEHHLDLVLIIEVVGIPDRLQSYEHALKPLPIGRQLQFIELRRPQQVENADLDGIAAYVSMSFSSLTALQDKTQSAFTEQLERQGVKLYVKDVPEGRLFEAQGYRGKLFSMLK